MQEENNNVAIIHRLFEECLNEDRIDLLPELVNSNVVNHNGNNQTTGLAAYEANLRWVRGMFPGGRFTVDGVKSNGDQAAAHWTLKANHSAPIAGVAPTGKPITNHGVVFYRFEQGKIAEVWAEVDQAGVLRQIGVEIPGAPVTSIPASSRA
jgi:predicted ester cyclase